MNGLVFTVKEEDIRAKQFPVAVSDDAYSFVCDIAERTGRSKFEIATKMILFAAAFTSVEGEK